MGQDERHGLGVKTGVNGVEHRARHRHRKVCFVNGATVGRDNRDSIVFADTPAYQCRGELPATDQQLSPGRAVVAIDQSHLFRIDPG